MSHSRRGVPFLFLSLLLLGVAYLHANQRITAERLSTLRQSATSAVQAYVGARTVPADVLEAAIVDVILVMLDSEQTPSGLPQSTRFILEQAGVPDPSATSGGGGAGNGTPGQVRPGEDPYGVIHVMELGAAAPAVSQAGTVPPASVGQAFEAKQGAGQEPPPRTPDKLHPVLRQMLASASPGQRVRVIVNLRDDLRMPRFPEPRDGTGPDLVAAAPPTGSFQLASMQTGGSATSRQADLARAEALVEQIRAQRAPGYQQLVSQWTAQHGAEVITQYWLIRGMLIEVPLSAVGQLSESDDVLFIQPEESGEEPPQNANASDDVDDGRARVRSDPYFNLRQTGGWIGLLDTGVRFSHTLFTSPNQISLRYDCTDGTCDGSPDPTDSHWNHGTGSAGILVGNDTLGNAFRGVTDISLDSLKIYTAAGLHANATVLGFQKAVAILDRVLVGEIQAHETDTGAIATAADNAFDAGCVVIAANGNYGPNASTVASPGIAHKAIGVGAVDVQSGNTPNYQSRGPAPDGRIKPDIQAPTNTETAGSASDNALRNFGGTSGATPYAAGVAALLRNWMRGGTGSIDPGKVHAFMILAGRDPFPFDNTTGTGELRLPASGTAWWGKVSVRNGQTIEIPITVPAGRSVVDAALWWPESASQDHNDIDLAIVDPSGTVRSSSVSVPSVFERARAQGAVAAGGWKIRVRGFTVRTATQDVYWAVHAGS